MLKILVQLYDHLPRHDLLLDCPCNEKLITGIVIIEIKKPFLRLKGVGIPDEHCSIAMHG